MLPIPLEIVVDWAAEHNSTIIELYPANVDDFIINPPDPIWGETIAVGWGDGNVAVGNGNGDGGGDAYGCGCGDSDLDGNGGSQWNPCLGF